MSIETMFTTFPRLETPRLILRQIQLSDADALFETFSDEAVMEFYGELPHRSVEDSRDLIRRQHEWYAQREGIRWGITRRGDDRVIGSCGFFKFDEEFSRAETGYELGRAYWGQGIMSEALGTIITFGLPKWGCTALKPSLMMSTSAQRGCCASWASLTKERCASASGSGAVFWMSITSACSKRSGSRK